MPTATVRIPKEKRDILKIIAGIEKIEMKAILSDLIDEYIERHNRTRVRRLKVNPQRTRSGQSWLAPRPDGTRT